jgi:hypothetical protein
MSGGATDGDTSHPSLHPSAATSQPCGAAMQGATVLKCGALDNDATKTVSFLKKNRGHFLKYY